MSIATNQQVYNDHQKRQKRGVGLPFLGWAGSGSVLGGASWAIAGVAAFFGGGLPLVAAAAPILFFGGLIAGALHAVRNVISGKTAKMQMDSVSADLQADGIKKPSHEQVGERLAERGPTLGMAIKRLFKPVNIAGNEKRPSAEFSNLNLKRRFVREDGLRGLATLGLTAGIGIGEGSLSQETLNFLADRIQFERLPGDTINARKFKLRLTAKEMNGEGIPPQVASELKGALQELQVGHYRTFLENRLPNNDVHDLALLQKERNFPEELTEKEKNEIEGWGSKKRAKVEGLDSEWADVYKDMYGKPGRPQINEHSVTFEQNTLQGHVASSMIEKAGKKATLSRDDVEGLRDVYVSGKAEDKGKSNDGPNGPDAGGNNKQPDEKQQSR